MYGDDKYFALSPRDWESDPLILSFGSGILLRSNGYMAQASLSTAGLTFSL